MTNHVSVPINRDATDQQVMAAYRKVVLKTHQDKGGRVADMQKLKCPRSKINLDLGLPESGRPGFQVDFCRGARRQKGGGRGGRKRFAQVPGQWGPRENQS